MKRAFLPAEILAIRAQWDAQTINVREWCQVHGCSAETIRRIGRRETYVHIGEGLAELPTVAGEDPAPGDLAASLSRLQQAVNQAPPGKAEVNEILKELKGGQ